MATTFTIASSPSVSASSWELFYTGSAGENILHALYIANIDGTVSANIDISLTDSSATDGDGTAGTLRARLAVSVPVPANSTLQFAEKTLNINTNDKLWLKASVDGDLSAFASVLEIT